MKFNRIKARAALSSFLFSLALIAYAQESFDSSLRDYEYRGENFVEEISGRIPLPSAKQLAFQDLELGLFIHFGMSTYTGQSSGDGKQPASMFYPVNLDCEQWMKVAIAMGARYVVLTARHEGGFCLWPTATTDYSVKKSPWKHGEGDVVKEYVAAARKYGLKVGLYHSSWHDANKFDKEDLSNDYFEDKPEELERFTKLQLAQLTELLTRYGPIDMIWFDHHGCPGVGSDQFWLRIDQLVAALQPGCMRFGPDYWINGQHGGRAFYPLWYGVNTGDGSKGCRPVTGDAEYGNPYGKYFVTWETNTPFSGNWFYNGPEVLPVDTMLARYNASVGRGCNFLPNFAPGKNGLMPDEVMSAAREFGNEIQERFGLKLKGKSGKKRILLELDKKTTIRNIVIMEELTDGQKVVAFEIDIKKAGGWETIYQGQTIGHKHIIPLNVETDTVRFICTKALNDNVKIREFAVY